jgi:hypothetical protein
MCYSAKYPSKNNQLVKNLVVYRWNSRNEEPDAKMR